MDDPSLGLKPTDRLGPWHDFTPEELAQFDDPWEEPPPERAFDADAFRAMCDRTSDGTMNVSPLWGGVYRRELPGPDEALIWLSAALDGRTPHQMYSVPEDFFHWPPTISRDTPLGELMERVSTLGHFVRDRARWGRMLRPLDGFLVVLQAIIDGVGSHEVVAWLSALGPPPAADREAAAKIVEACIRGLEDPFGGMNTRLDYGELAATYPTPFLVRTAFEVGAIDGYMWNVEECWRRLADPQDILACSDLMLGCRQLRPSPADVRFWVARFGVSDILGLFERVVRRNPTTYPPELYAEAFRVRDPAWVMLLQPLAARRKSAPIVDAYLRNEGINAIEGLLQLAASRGKKRLWALDWLGTLAADPQQRPLIEQRLPDHPGVAEAVGELLNVADERTHVIPQWVSGDTPNWAWLDLAKLEAALVGDGEVVEPAALAAAIASGTKLKGRVTNLSDVLWSVVDQWWFRESGADEVSAFFAAHAAEDDIVRLTEAVQSRQAWPRRRAGYAQRMCAMRTIAAIDHPLARRGLLQFTNLYSEALRQVAEELVDAAVDAAGCSADEYEDLAVPSLGLDERGERRFDYGPRKIRLVVRGRNDVEFIDESTEKSYTRLPPTKKSDDARLVAGHRETWKLIRDPLLAIFGEEADRMESSMIRRRSWSAKKFAEFLRHPVLGHLARRVIWLVDGAPCLVTNEGDACDVELDAMVIGAAATIHVAHPVDLDPVAWTEVLADQEIIQPFDQVTRIAPVVEFIDVALGSDDLIDAALGAWDFPIREDGRRTDLALESGGERVVLVLSPGLDSTKHGRRGRYQDPTQKIVAIEGEPTALHLAEIYWLVGRAGS